MAVRIILDCPHPYVGPRLREALLALSGAVLAVIGTLAWLLIIPMSVLAIASFQGEDVTLELEDGRVITAQAMLAAWAAASATA